MLRRYGHLTASFEALGGYDTATAVNKVANGLSIGADMRQQLFDQLSGGEKTRVNLAPADPGGHGYPAAGRADQPSGLTGHGMAGGVSPQLSRHGGGHLP